MSRYPDDAFLRLFRMHRASFWQLVELVTNVSGMDYWGRSQDRGMFRSHPINLSTSPFVQATDWPRGGMLRDVIS